jgi:hypothetical protein
MDTQHDSAVDYDTVVIALPDGRPMAIVSRELYDLTVADLGDFPERFRALLAEGFGDLD